MIGLGSSYGANVDAIETSTVVPTACNTAYGLVKTNCSMTERLNL